jgi:uncharacterized SAM-binding protein YcdF (DUF218 family)
VRTFFRRLSALALLWLLFVGLPAWTPLRVLLWRPLTMDTPSPQAEVAYVLGAGPLTLPERLGAAADLYHRGHVRRILIPADPTPSRHDFVTGVDRTASDWTRAHLVFLGVPAERITAVAVEDGLLGTASEARAVSAAVPAVRRLVIVSSPMHLRRAHLAFTRVLGPAVVVEPVAASEVPDGPDFHRPIWLEYLKLAVYAVTVGP